MSNSVLRHLNIAAAGELVPAARTTANSFSPPRDMSEIMSVRGTFVMWVLLQLVKMNVTNYVYKKEYF